MIEIVMYVFVAVVYSVATYLKKALKPEGLPFDKVKLASTAIVGAFVGLVLGGSGIVPTEASIETQLAGMTGLVVVVETILTITKRALVR